jgi:hypothetical protein
MSDEKVPARRTPALPSVFNDIFGADNLPAGRHSFGFQRDVIANNQRVVDNSSSYNMARARQSDSLAALLDARIRLGLKYAEVVDLPNVLAEAQRQREHARVLAEQRRALELVKVVHEMHLTLARHETELAKQREQGVRAERNLDAARRVADTLVDTWYQQAMAQRNEAEAVKQDTDHDLKRAQPAVSTDAIKGAVEQELAKTVAIIEHEIELARQRSNPAAVLALQNFLARLKAA